MRADFGTAIDACRTTKNAPERFRLSEADFGLHSPSGIRHSCAVPATLTSLRIRNLALVEELEWQLAPGFIAVTGETGSGKSIIVGALQLILGERADKALIRTGADGCTVEAVFQHSDTRALNAQLEEFGVEPCEGGELILKRVFTAAGTNRQFINGSPTTLAVLGQLGDGLVDLHGPHDHQSLLFDTKQLDLLDAFANAGALREKYETQFRALNRLVAEHAELSTSEAALEREVDLLRHQVEEIESAQLRPDEEEDLLARYSVASNSRRLLELATQIVGRLSEADDALLTRLGEIGKLLRDLERVDPAAARFTESHVRASTELEDLAQSLQSYAEDMDLDPERLAQMEERVTMIETLKRKYGGHIGDVITFGDQAAERLRKIESRGAELDRLEKEIAAARQLLQEAGAKLGAKRQTAAPKLAASVTAHLRDLGFKKSDFRAALTALEKPGPHGLESVAFLFAPNPGEPPKPLKSIASSGEISRVMLAVKSSLAAQDTIPLLVFDEIDANVGGEIAHAVGAKMKSLAAEHQVLCISHLPQVAAQADTQFVVTKEFTKDRTLSHLELVEGPARVEEIARMLGGKGDSALAHAKTLLSQA
jgi:DNA repair protein RecN (Recombination protein N)